MLRMLCQQTQRSEVELTGKVTKKRGIFVLLNFLLTRPKLTSSEQKKNFTKSFTKLSQLCFLANIGDT